jgi:hypothetical protein
VSISDNDQERRIHEMLGTFAATVQHLSDEALVALHQEHLRQHNANLARITRRELDWRGLHLDDHR